MKTRVLFAIFAALFLSVAASGQDVRNARPEKFVDFKAVQPDGKVLKLSDFAGRGKYVLVDFWASWCGPCREEIPNLKNIYNDFRGENFDIVGVPVSDKVENTRKAVKDLGIPWTQIMGTTSSVPEAYGFSYIPYIILVGPDGTILEKNLRGDAIRETVKKYVNVK